MSVMNDVYVPTAKTESCGKHRNPTRFAHFSSSEIQVTHQEVPELDSPDLHKCTVVNCVSRGDYSGCLLQARY